MVKNYEKFERNFSFLGWSVVASSYKWQQINPQKISFFLIFH